MSRSTQTPESESSRAVGNVSGCPDGRDSQVTFRFLSQGVEVALITEDPPLDEAWFVGLASGASIDRLEIREVGSVVNAFGDPYCENDFVGSVLVGR